MTGPFYFLLLLYYIISIVLVSTYFLFVIVCWLHQPVGDAVASCLFLSKKRKLQKKYMKTNNNKKLPCDC